MCDPKPKLPETSRRQLWHLLASKDDPAIKNLTFEILSWIQVTIQQIIRTHPGPLKDSSYV